MINKTNKKAFTLLELVFVIVIIGIMAGIGSSAFRANYLLDDTNFITAKIKEAQFKGIGYEHNGFGVEDNTPDFTNGCIRIEQNSLEENATSSGELNYKLHVSLTPSDTTICFDSKGRPHQNDFTQATLLNNQTTITLNYATQHKTITIEPITGYLLID